MKHENEEVDRIVERLFKYIEQASKDGYVVSESCVRSQITYVYQLGHFDGRIKGIKEMAR
jgi:hypothetical protein